MAIRTPPVPISSWPLNSQRVPVTPLRHLDFGCCACLSHRHAAARAEGRIAGPAGTVRGVHRAAVPGQLHRPPRGAAAAPPRHPGAHPRHESMPVLKQIHLCESPIPSSTRLDRAHVLKPPAAGSGLQKYHLQVSVHPQIVSGCSPCSHLLRPFPSCRTPRHFITLQSGSLPDSPHCVAKAEHSACMQCQSTTAASPARAPLRYISNHDGTRQTQHLVGRLSICDHVPFLHPSPRPPVAHGEVIA